MIPKRPDSVISHLKTGEVGELKKNGVIDKGMIPKVDSAVAAIQSGVEKVSFVDGRVPHAVCWKSSPTKASARKSFCGKSDAINIENRV